MSGFADTMADPGDYLPKVSHDPDATFPPLLGSFPREWIANELDERERHAFDEGERDEIAEWRKAVDELTDDELTQAHYNAGDEVMDALPMAPVRYLLDAVTAITYRKGTTT